MLVIKILIIVVVRIDANILLEKSKVWLTYFFNKDIGCCHNSLKLVSGKQFSH